MTTLNLLQHGSPAHACEQCPLEAMRDVKATAAKSSIVIVGHKTGPVALAELVNTLGLVGASAPKARWRL